MDTKEVKIGSRFTACTGQEIHFDVKDISKWRSHRTRC